MLKRQLRVPTCRQQPWSLELWATKSCYGLVWLTRWRAIRRTSLSPRWSLWACIYQCNYKNFTWKAWTKSIFVCLFLSWLRTFWNTILKNSWLVTKLKTKRASSKTCAVSGKLTNCHTLAMMFIEIFPMNSICVCLLRSTPMKGRVSAKLQSIRYLGGQFWAVHPALLIGTSFGVAWMVKTIKQVMKATKLETI